MQPSNSTSSNSHVLALNLLNVNREQACPHRMQHRPACRAHELRNVSSICPEVGLVVSHLL
eukprot:432645-Amorphochlora_amoeboformis.AAC.1